MFKPHLSPAATCCESKGNGPSVVQGMPLKSGGRVPALDGVRGLAILLVLVWHYVGCHIAPGGGLSSLAWHSLSLSWSGVNLFMLLSGFLITGILLDQKESPNLFKVFYARRALRILPLYFVLLAVFLVASSIRPPEWEWLLNHPLPIWSYFTLTQNWVMAFQHRFGADGLDVTWSLALEEQFYLLAPLAIRYLPRRVVISVFSVSVLFAPILRMMIDGTGAYVLVPARADSLMLGGLLAYAVRNPELMKMLRSHRQYLFPTMAVMGIGLAVISFKVTTAPLYDPFISFWLSIFYAQLFMIPYLYQGGTGDKALSWSPLCWLGQRSYAIYLLHKPVLGVLFGNLLGRAPGLDSVHALMITGLALVVTGAIAEFSMLVLEGPCLRLGHHFRYTKRSAPPVPEQAPVGVAVVS